MEQLQPEDSETLQSTDWDEYESTYIFQSLNLNETDCLLYTRFLSDIADYTHLEGQTVHIDLEKVKDWSNPIKDAFNHQPLKTAELVQRLVQKQTETEQKHFVNITGQADCTEIQEENIGKLISLSAYVEHITGRKSRKIKVPWFCQQGHATIRFYRRGERIEKPLSCDFVDEEEGECKNNPYKQANTKKQAISYSFCNQHAKPVKTQIEQTVLKREDGTNRERRIKGEWDSNHINKVEEGQTVDITGILRHDEGEGESQDYYIHILGIQNEDKTEELTDTEKENVEDWVNNTDLRERVMKIDEYEDERFNPRLSVLCSVVKGNAKDNENIHTLLVGPAGTGKTELAENGINLLEKGEKVEMQKASKSGMVGSVVKRDMLGGESWIVKHGSLARADGSTVLIDEMDKVERAGKINILSESMESRTASIEKVADKTLETDISIIGTCNPVMDWGYSEEKINALPKVFENHILDRFDLILWMDKADQTSAQIAKMFINEENKNGENEKFKNWVQYAKEFSPVFKPDTEGFRELKKCLELVKSTSNRTEQTIANICQAIAKLRLNETVQKQDVKLAWALWTDYKEEMEDLTFPEG